MCAGCRIIYPDPKLRYCANLLHMMFSMPYDEYCDRPGDRRCAESGLLLHTDHEQNCSTSTVRMVGSEQSQPVCLVRRRGVALWGPLHGGANVAVLEMLESIHKGGMTPHQCIWKWPRKRSGLSPDGLWPPGLQKLRSAGQNAQSRLRPRAGQAGRDDPLLDIARKLEELALKDSYFVDRKLYPNVDFYCGIIMRAMGIPTNMFTVMFAIGRLPGWIAHWKEQHDDPHGKISRPRQIYTGLVNQRYVPIEQRGGGK